MRELEVKLKLLGDADAIPDALRRLWPTLVAQECSQTDRVLVAPGTDLLNPTFGMVVARVRQSVPGGASCAVKVRGRVDLDRQEFEFSVNPVENSHAALLALGLQPVVVVKKRRRTWRVDTTLSVNFDVVDGLGCFLEFELLSDESVGGEDRLDALVALVKNTIAADCVLETKAYDRLLLENKP